VNAATTDSPPATLTNWSRYGLIAVAWLFAALGIVQVFLAGLSVFDGPRHWQDHVDFGRTIGLLTYLLPVLALLGRVGRERIGHAVVVPVLFVVQMLLANADTGWVAAFHPINGFFLIGAAGSLGARTLELVRFRPETR
jgi:hypothetical protein